METLRTLRLMRKRAGLSQSALGRILGVSRWTICRAERGWQTPHTKLNAMMTIWIERMDRTWQER
jgi:DNA-binding XRE family transcriptional regulator